MGRLNTRPVAKWVALLCALLLVAGACGLQEEEQAELIEEVQYDLLGTTTSTTSTTVVDTPIFPVFFFWHTAGDNRLRQITRTLAERPSAAQVLTELVDGPLAEDLEQNPDLQSRLDPSMEPQISQVDGGTYQIQITWPAEDGLTTEQAAEFVCTATQFAEIDAITIVNNDEEPFTFTLSGAGAVPIPGPARTTDFGECIEELLTVDPELDPENTEEDAEDPEAQSTTTSP